MSECKNKECTREAYVLDKPYCSSMCCISDLERQLAEAMELVFSAYQEGWNDNRNNFDSWETHWIDSDSRYSLDKLKEQG